MSKSLTLCVDASVVVRLVNSNDHPGFPDMWKDKLRDNKRMVAPGLMRYEVVNAIYKQLRAGLISAATAEFSIELLLRLPVEYFHDEFIHRDALRITTQYNLPAAYDAHYLALTQHLGAELWTADKRLYNAVHQHLDFVHLVE